MVAGNQIKNFKHRNVDNNYLEGWWRVVLSTDEIIIKIMKAVIIGGGIIGLSSAYYLLKDGWDVTIIDRSDLADNCSYGNLGMIVPSHFVPLAAPGMVAQGIRWMFSNKSPFYVKPSLDLNLIKWGLSFMKSAISKACRQISKIPA